MKRFIITSVILAVLGLIAVPQVGASGGSKRVRGPHCGQRFTNADECSFRYQGGQLYVGGSIRGVPPRTGTATIRLEARSRVTGARYLLLSCTYAGGGCSAGGQYHDVEDLRKGQKLICTVEGVGRGLYECGTIIKRH